MGLAVISGLRGKDAADVCAVVLPGFIQKNKLREASRSGRGLDHHRPVSPSSGQS